MPAENHDVLKKPIIFIGNPRSGTTIISKIVMMHKDLGFPSNWHNAFPKSTWVNYLRYAFQNKLWSIYSNAKYAFRSSENYTIWSKNLEQDLDFGRDFLLGKKASPAKIEHARDYFSKVVKLQGKKRLAFKLTGPAKIEYLQSIFPDAQFVRILRNPVPTVSSLLKSTFWGDLGAKKLWWTGVYTDEEIKFAQEYVDNPIALTAIQTKKVSDITEMEIKKLGLDVLEVMYDDFTRSPEQVIATILKHVDLPYDKRCFDYLKKNKIYNKNKKDEDYFEQHNLELIRAIYNQESSSVSYPSK